MMSLELMNLNSFPYSDRVHSGQFFCSLCPERYTKLKNTLKLPTQHILFLKCRLLLMLLGYFRQKSYKMWHNHSRQIFNPLTGQKIDTQSWGHKIVIRFKVGKSPNNTLMNSWQAGILRKFNTQQGNDGFYLVDVEWASTENIRDSRVVEQHVHNFVTGVVSTFLSHIHTQTSNRRPHRLRRIIEKFDNEINKSLENVGR